MKFLAIGRSKCIQTAPAIRPGYGLEHSPAWETYIAKFDDCNIVQALLSITTRVIDDEEIGDYVGAKPLTMPDRSDLIVPLQHCQSLGGLKSAVQEYFTGGKDSRGSASRPKVPIMTELVASTFSPYDPAPPMDDHAPMSTQVHAAVTFVSELPGCLRLPPSFTLAIHRHLHVNDVREILLSRFNKKLPAATKAHLLEKYPTTPPKLYLWVMPQGLEHGKLYLWQRGPLEQFLSAAYAATNDRRLYLEARLAPTITSEIKMDDWIRSGDPAAAEVSEDDDLHNTLLSVTDGSQSDSSFVYTPDSDSRMSSMVQVESLPPRQADDCAQCHVVVQFDTSNLPDLNGEVFRRANYTLPLEVTPRFLSTTVLYHACADFRRSQSEMMHVLKAAGKGLHMRSFTAFNDDRDSYLRRDSTQNSRIAKLSDLFLSRKSLRSSPEIPIVVKIDIIDLESEAKNFDSAEYDFVHHHFAFHRVATADPSQYTPAKKLRTRIQPATVFGPQEEVQLNPIQVAHVIRYPRCWPPSGVLVGVAYQEINGVVIGDTWYADEEPRKEDQIWLEEYKDITPPEKKQEAFYRNMFREAWDFSAPEGVPVSPSLTFLPYVGPGAKLDGERIHVAVRIVNSLQVSRVAVPMGVVVKVSDGVGMKKTICEALSGKLRQFYNFRTLSNGLKMLQDEGGKWRWDLWVLPQKVVEKEAMVMYRFREGSLRVFLDAEMVKSGVMTLYMEAHIVE